MLFKIIGYVWLSLGGLGTLISCSTWLTSGKAGDMAKNYHASEVFVLQAIFYFFIFILPGLVVVYMGRNK